MTGDVAVDVRGLRVRYGSFEAVRGIDLQVRCGEVFALLGTNGAGKTSTLEVLEGLVVASAGAVSVLGLDPHTDRVALHRRVGIQMQEGGFVEDLTVGESLRLWRRLCARPDTPEAVLRRFELTHRGDVAVRNLSGGEKRRLDLAMAVWGSPELVVLDEPTTGLDPASRQRAWEVIRKLRSTGRTVLLTTHYLEEAEALADRAAIMHNGRIVVHGTLAEIVATQPARFSAALPPDAPELPSLAGTVARAGDRLEVRTDELQAGLTALLTWAQHHQVALADLRAAPASLADIYHAVLDQEAVS